jgi:hypothetical protein
LALRRSDTTPWLCLQSIPSAPTGEALAVCVSVAKRGRRRRSRGRERRASPALGGAHADSAR